MNQIQFSRIIGCIGLIGLLLGACSFPVKTPSVPAQKNAENMAVVQTPEVVEPEQSSKASIQEKPSQKVAVADLADGNYKFCTEPPPKTPSDDDGLCFVFRKTNNSVVGQYFHGAPKGDRSVCISGVLNGKMVTGVGYEPMFGWDRPITSADIASMPPEPIWGDSEGRGLRISPPRLYATGKNAGGYYGWMRFDGVGLDLSGFYQHDIEKLILPEKCPNYDFYS